MGGHLHSLDSQAEEQPDLSQVLASLESALGQLDAAGAPGHIGAYLDMAVEQLRVHLTGQNERDARTDREFGSA